MAEDDVSFIKIYQFLYSIIYHVNYKRFTEKALHVNYIYELLNALTEYNASTILFKFGVGLVFLIVEQKNQQLNFKNCFLGIIDPSYLS